MSVSEKEILKLFKRSFGLWMANLALQMVMIPTFTSLFFFHKATDVLYLFGVWLFLGSIFSIAHFVLRKGISLVLKEYSYENEEYEKIVNQLIYYMKFNSLCFVPFLGLLTCITASRVYCMTDLFRPSRGSLFQDWLCNCDRCFRAWMATHAVNIVFGNMFWILLVLRGNSFVDGSGKQSLIVFTFVCVWGLVSLIINDSFVRSNLSLSYRVREMEEEIFKKMKIWKKSIYWNFVAYIPALGVLALIPFFIAREILSDMREQDRNYLAQYIKKCRTFIWILIGGSLLSLPYVIFISVKHDKFTGSEWVMIHLIVNLITTTAINFCLYWEKVVHADMYLSDSKYYEKIKELNSLSKICSFVIIFTFIIALPSIVIFMNKLRKFRRGVEHGLL